MNERRLRALLRDVPIPDADPAQERGMRLLQQAYAERRPAGRPVLPRLALALAAAILLAAVLLSPAGAAVREWIDDVFGAGVPNAERALTDIPGGGRLLVHSPQGPWVVHPDGSRRLLGRYREATWSPHGLFVAAAEGRTLSAIEPGGTPHWSLSAGAAVAKPRWSPSGLRIAYLAGDRLRVVRADGSADGLVAAATPSLAPAWFPPGLHLLAYATRDGRLRIVDADTAESLASVPSERGLTGISWSPDGSLLVQTTQRAIAVRRVTTSKLAAAVRLGPAHSIPLPAGSKVLDASFSPRGVLAVLVRLRRNGPRSAVVLADRSGTTVRRLFTVSGRLAQMAWSPRGDRLLVSWPEADQWLFLPVGSRGRIRAVGNVSEASSPGAAGSFPRLEGWCCAASAGATAG